MMTDRSARRFLFTLIGSAAVLFSMALTASYIAVTRGYTSPEQHLLLRTQLDRVSALDPDRPVDILLLGDSSLGNAISERALAEATGAHVVKLPLTGSFGYRGTLNMLRRVHAAAPVRRVVVMHAVDVAQRDVAVLGDALTTPEPGLTTALDIAVEELSLDNLQAAALWLAGKRRPRALVDGYIAQSRGRFTAPLRTVTPRSPLPQKTVALGRIAEFCAATGLDCAYAHGPLWDEACEAGATAIARLDELIDAAGLRRMPGTPLCLPRSMLGDAADHVHPDWIAHTTDRYVDLLGRAGQKP